MPRGDGTGPDGFGPMTGRAAGFCAGYEMPGFLNPLGRRGFYGRGRGGGFGRGRGFRNLYYATGVPGWMRYGVDPYPLQGVDRNPKEEAEALKRQVSYMQESMNAQNERIRELESSPTESSE